MRIGWSWVVVVLSLMGCGDDDDGGVEGMDGGERVDASGALDAGSSSGEDASLPFSLTVEAANVLGTVSLASAACAEERSCSAVFERGAEATFEAVPRPGMRFAGWRTTLGPAVDCADPVCTTTLAERTTVVADFDSDHNLVFATEEMWAGDALGGLSGADDKCNAAAEAANLPGTYRAWLSGSAEDARDRLGDARGWLRVDGFPFADTVDDVVGGRVLAPAGFLDTGLRQWVEVWTGTGADGRLGGDGEVYVDGVPIEPGSCEDWTSTEGAATVGSTTHVGAMWTDFGARPCEQERGLLCLGTEHSAALEVEAVEGRVAFVSEGFLDPSTGLAGADALCASEASAASLEGTFKALLATSTATAVSRFDLDGPTWVRPDGVPWVRAAGDLAVEADLVTALNVQADGTYVSSTEQNDQYAFTGGPFETTPDANRICEDWTLGALSEDVDVLMGSPQGAYENGASCCSGPCSARRRVYCLEE